MHTSADGLQVIMGQFKEEKNIFSLFDYLTI